MYSAVISPILTFPPIEWWAIVQKHGMVCYDDAEMFRKMTWRNRYRIAGSNGPILLSVPLAGGREQRIAMRDVQIDNKDDWQVQHWRTLVSVYRRAPYFEHYEPELKQIFETEFTRLTDFNTTCLQWVKKQLGFMFEEREGKNIDESVATDLRKLKDFGSTAQPPQYYQVFEDRTGFIPNLSILDLLFAEGPYTGRWIMEHYTR